MSKFTFTKYEKDNSELPSANIYIYIHCKDQKHQAYSLMQCKKYSFTSTNCNSEVGLNLKKQVYLSKKKTSNKKKRGTDEATILEWTVTEPVKKGIFSSKRLPFCA